MVLLIYCIIICPTCCLSNVTVSANSLLIYCIIICLFRTWNVERGTHVTVCANVCTLYSLDSRNFQFIHMLIQRGEDRRLRSCVIVIITTSISDMATHAKRRKCVPKCGECSENCEGDDIQCVSCKKVYHIVCEKISYELVTAPSFADSYTCMSCLKRIVGFRYQFKPALTRLSKATKLGFSNFKACVDQEAQLIPDCEYAISKSNFCLDVHQVSLDILRQHGVSDFGAPYDPESKHRGSCLFDAVSVVLNGDSMLSTELRVRTLIEMVKNADMYENQSNLKRFLILSPTYEKACRDCASPRGWSSVWTMLALANVIGMNINSIYPPVNGVQDKAHQKLNFVIKPRVASSVTVNVMWTKETRHTKGIWTPNHFVPVIPTKDFEKSFQKIYAAKGRETEDATQGKDQAEEIDEIESGKNKEEESFANSDDSDTENEAKDKDGSRNSDDSDTEDEAAGKDGSRNNDDSDTEDEAKGKDGSRNSDDSDTENEAKGKDASRNSDDSDTEDEAEGKDGSRKNGIDSDVNDGLNESRDDLFNMHPSFFSTPCKEKNSSKREKEKPQSEWSTSMDFIGIIEVFKKLNSPDAVVLESIPRGIKENISFVIRDDQNNARRENGKKGVYVDDCGVWDGKQGRCVKTYYEVKETGDMRSVVKKNNEYCIKKQVDGKTVTEKIEPQPSMDDIIEVNRYYATLKRCNSYKRRISRVENVEGLKIPLALVEYIGAFPDNPEPHGNAIYQDSAYVRTDSEILEKVAKLAKHSTPREVYKTMALDDSVNAPRDFKQCRNVKFQEQKKSKEGKGTECGKKSNLADEVLECLAMVGDGKGFVQEVRLSRGMMPSIICYTEQQKEDLNFFLAKKSGYPIGVDRTFNLGCYYVTVLVYKNIRVVRTDDPNQHPIFLGPILLHRDATFTTYNYFFAALKSILSTSIDAFELSLGKDIYIGSDQEKAIVKAIDSNFPASLRFLCTKHLKENTIAYMQTKVGIPQKERNEICQQIFGKSGIVTADTSRNFEEQSDDVLKSVSKFPKFAEYFTNRLKPSIDNYVNTPKRSAPFGNLWTNNNSESINHIIKLDADWKSHRTPELVKILHDITLLQFKDLRRSLYSSGNYRLANDYKKYGVRRECWGAYIEEEKNQIFDDFLKNKKKVKSKSEKAAKAKQPIKSSYCNFSVQMKSGKRLAKKTGQKTRVKATKTKPKSSR